MSVKHVKIKIHYRRWQCFVAADNVQPTSLLCHREVIVRNCKLSNTTNDDAFFCEAERDANCIELPVGMPDDFYVTKQYSVPLEGFGSEKTDADCDREGIAFGIMQQDVDRLGISRTNVTLPIALMLLDRTTYPSLSSARKACR